MNERERSFVVSLQKKTTVDDVCFVTHVHMHLLLRLLYSVVLGRSLAKVRVETFVSPLFDPSFSCLLLQMLSDIP